MFVIVIILCIYRALYLNIPMYAIIVTMFSFTGLVMYAYYSTCDPLLNKEITLRDQVYVTFFNVSQNFLLYMYVILIKLKKLLPEIKINR